MSKLIAKSEPFLKYLARSGPQRRKQLLKHATREELQSLCEICLNILKGNLPLDDRQLRSLKKKKTLIRDLGDRHKSIKKKRQLANQHGGFLGSIAAIALPLITDLITRKILK